MASTPKRPLTPAEKLTKTVNNALGQRGCNYCRLFFPSGRVRKTRNRFGLVKFICETCELGRIAARNHASSNGNGGNGKR